MLWLLLFIGPMLFGFYAQNKIRTAYSKNVRIGSRGRISGYEAAQAVMSSAGINDVEIVQVPGELTDHYDPTRKRLALSEQNYRGTSLAALGVAAHEAGHAIQHKVGYSMMKVRQTLVPVTQIASTISSWVMMGGIFLFMFAGSALGYNLLAIGATALAVVVLFQLITLPVEFDASRRAKVQLVELGILERDEMKGVDETLAAAALTYVAAFVGALSSLLYILSIMNSSRD